MLNKFTLKAKNNANGNFSTKFLRKQKEAQMAYKACLTMKRSNVSA